LLLRRPVSGRPQHATSPSLPMPSKVLTTDGLPALLSAVGPIFGEAQLNAANHRKNVLLLRKIAAKTAELTSPRRKGGPDKRVGELAFAEAFEACLARVLPVKKGIAVADRLVKFVAKFVAALLEKRASSLLTELVAQPS
jgi:condensin complex subunit 3